MVHWEGLELLLPFHNNGSFCHVFRHFWLLCSQYVHMRNVADRTTSCIDSDSTPTTNREKKYPCLRKTDPPAEKTPSKTN